MKLTNDSSPVKVQLSRNLVRQIKRGHAWVYGNALRKVPNVPPGTPAILLDNRGGKEIGRGYLDSKGPITLRVCTTVKGVKPNSLWAERQFTEALSLRQNLFAPYQLTSGFRLFNGEGDGLPGLVCDIYENNAILITDGPAAEAFWQTDGIAEWLGKNLDIQAVFRKRRAGFEKQVSQIWGDAIQQPIRFWENGLAFSADLVEGQKSGFFLDQRNNRRLIGQICEDKSVLNAFGYTGGFSVFAGKGGASQVVTLDVATPALKAAIRHWEENQLPADNHETIAQDAFKYLEKSVKHDRTWDVVILDPPSFAPSEASVPAAVKAYTKLITLGAQVTDSGGILAAASCSSHIHREQFLEIITTAISQARRKATVLGIHGQPADHPAPLAMPELDYLKFVLLKLD